MFLFASGRPVSHGLCRHESTQKNLNKQLYRQDSKKSSVLPIATAPVLCEIPAARVTKTIEPASAESGPDCQGTLHHIRDEVSEKLVYIQARVVVNRCVRLQYGCTCHQREISGSMPAHIIPKGVAKPSLIAQGVISKYCDHMPPHRQQIPATTAAF
ncbi:IS66 family transposase zinc-finger binding domain-containing protein [Cedecea neteri]|uniref:Transposase IS66 zinc-finger binding domain-containing protein n=1 Tax=Cedecea neteri TaxID=158822 RepID=A0A291E633_9ENTR|nr:hypothetical protein CO704_25065 [Cedecea neteri]